MNLPYLHSARIADRFLAITEGYGILCDATKDELIRNEWSKYVVIGMVSAFESLCKDWTAYIIDRDPTVRSRVASVREQTLDWSIVLPLLDQRLTVGECIAHMSSFQSLEQVDRHFSGLLDTGFLKALTPSIQETIDDCDAPFSESDAKKMSIQAFSYRHVCVHETPDLDRVNLQEAVDATTGIHVLACSMDSLFMKRWPPTQEEIAAHNQLVRTDS